MRSHSHHQTDRACTVLQTIRLVERARRSLVADRGTHRLAADNVLHAEIAHRPRHSASGAMKPSRFICRHTMRTP
jgi:hypothetical protein